MGNIEVSTFIKCQPQEVFDYMTNPDNASKWQSGTECSEWISSGPVGVGSVQHTIARMMGRKLEVDSEVSLWAPPSVWGIKSRGGMMKFEATNKFEPKDGGTLLTQTAQIETGGIFKLGERMAVRQLKKQVEADGQALKKLLEAM